MQDIIHLLRNKLDLMLEEEESKDYFNLNTSEALSLELPPVIIHANVQSDIPLAQQKDIAEITALLTPLHDVSGYLASALFDSKGELLAHHCRNTAYNIETLAAYTVVIINTLISAIQTPETGKFEFIEITINGLHLLWGITEQSLTVILLDADTKMGLGFAKIALKTVGNNAAPLFST